MADDPLDELLSDSLPAEIETSTAPAAPETQTTTETTTAPVRDDLGRFAPRADGTDQMAQAVVEGGVEPDKGKPPAGFVPLAALHESRSKADRLEGRVSTLMEQVKALMAQPRPQAQPAQQAAPVDIWDDPKKFVGEHVTSVITPVQQTLQKALLRMSRSDAIREHGAETVTAAQAALRTAVEQGTITQETVAERLRASDDFFGEIVNWHRENETRRKVGNDPDKWLEAEIEKRMGDPAFQAKVIEAARASAANGNARQQAPAISLPPSIGRLGSNGNAAVDPDTSSEGLFNFALR